MEHNLLSTSGPGTAFGVLMLPVPLEQAFDCDVLFVHIGFIFLAKWKGTWQMKSVLLIFIFPMTLGHIFLDI